MEQSGITCGPKATVIVCTHNRAGLLRGCLAALLDQSQPVDSFEIVVVDNRSNDDTRAVTEESAATCSHLRYVYEDELGLAAARNRGIREATGELLLFTDDDIIVAHDWIEQMLAAFARDSDAAVVAGRVELDYDGPPPDWLVPELQNALASFNYGVERATLPAGIFPVGANMAMPASWFDKVGDFETSLGRRGNQLISSEEEEFVDRVRRNGGVVVYEPRSMVRHRVPVDRLTRSWFLRRALGQGRSTVRMGDPSATRGRAVLIARALYATAGSARLAIGGIPRLRVDPAVTVFLPAVTRLGMAVEYSVRAVRRTP